MDGNKINKPELVAKAAKDAGLTKKSVAEAYDALLDALVALLAEGESICISGLGTFSVKKKAAYVARNPKKNEAVEMPQTNRITFLPSKTLKEKINET